MPILEVRLAPIKTDRTDKRQMYINYSNYRKRDAERLIPMTLYDAGEEHEVLLMLVHAA